MRAILLDYYDYATDYAAAATLYFSSFFRRLLSSLVHVSQHKATTPLNAAMANRAIISSKLTSWSSFICATTSDAINGPISDKRKCNSTQTGHHKANARFLSRRSCDFITCSFIHSKLPMSSLASKKNSKSLYPCDHATQINP